MLQDCFDNTSRDLSAEGSDLKEYAGTDLGYINICPGNVLTQKTIKVFPNKKSWINSNVRILLKELSSQVINKHTVKHRGNYSRASEMQSTNTKNCGMTSRH